MELGISTSFLYHNGISESLKIARNAGFTAVEIWANSYSGEHIHFDWRSESQVADLKNTLADLGLRANSMHAPFANDLDISDSNEQMRSGAVAATLKSLDAIHKIGGSFLVLHPASKESHIQEKNYRFKQSRKSIEEILEYGRQAGVKIAIENQLPHILGGDAATISALIEGLPRDWVGICFDTSHAHLWHGRRETAMFKELCERVFTLHVSDNNGRYDDHFFPGRGNIDWLPFVQALKECNYNGVFMLEIIGDLFKPEKTEESKALYNEINKLINQ